MIRRPPSPTLFPSTTPFRSAYSTAMRALRATWIDEEPVRSRVQPCGWTGSDDHTSELQSPCNLVCRLLLDKQNPPARIAECGSTARPALAEDVASTHPLRSP